MDVAAATGSELPRRLIRSPTRGRVLVEPEVVGCSPSMSSMFNRALPKSEGMVVLGLLDSVPPGDVTRRDL